VFPALPQIGATELIILLTIIMLFFGAKRIPDLARSLGKGAREFRKGASKGADALRERSSALPEDERNAHPEGVRAEQNASS
jgi:sec-independent protein translocase protein TatA